MAELARKAKRYPSDLTNEEWARSESLLLKPSRRLRKPAVQRALVSAIADALLGSCDEPLRYNPRYIATFRGGLPEHRGGGRR